MKASYIIGILLIGVAIAAIASMYGDASTYEDLATAQANTEKKFHIVGTLNKSKERYYEPKKEANFFSFYMIDEKGMESKVVYHHPEPIVRLLLLPYLDECRP
jgi:cytochrome c-type biogenesis protein CcmE